ncbi:MAG: DUF115 domain-containing protein [Clostridiales bacterium]|nr:DUF115 domain-containing protein [Clostridiales bacterium]
MSKIVDISYGLHNLKVKLLRWPRFVLLNRESARLIKRNKMFKNHYEGKRCFILGNGPSLKDLDFSLLADEYTFTVNQVSRNPQFNNVKTNFHFWVDSIFFDIDLSKPEDVELLNCMKSVKADDNSPVVFYPIEREGFVKEHHLDDILDVHYFLSGLHFTKRTEVIDYTKIVPSFGTVVQWCITMAIYMGFKEIYLLGCENTGIINNINSSLRIPVTDYNYEITENEQKRLEKSLQKKRLYDYVMTYAETLKDYALLNAFCSRNGIVIKNCTPLSAIDSITQCKLDSVLDNSIST